MPGNGEEFGPCPHCGQLHREDVLLCPVTEKLLPLEGRILDGKFRFNKQLGEGGMGAVFRADNILVKKTVAIKVMHVQFSRDEGVLARFRNEATAAGRIGSKFICDILDLGKSQLGPYIVMEMLKGQDFAQFVQEHAPVDHGTVVMVMRQALEGLEAAHAAGIVHRDLKPENIFLHQPEPGHLLVKLMDFGISKFTEGNDAGKTGMGVLMGTPEYMSPEQTEGAAQVDHRTDIWAMGVILYWALTGKNPFMGPTMAATLMNVSMREAPPLSQVSPGLPPQLVAVVERCIRKNPDERWSSCTELRAALEPFEDLHGRFFVPYASRVGASAGGAAARSAPPPGGTVASSGPPPGMQQQQQQQHQHQQLSVQPIGAGPTFSNELVGAPSQAQPTLSGGFSGVDEDYGRPQSNMGGGIGGIIAIAVVGVALVGGGGYFIWAQATQKDKIAEVTKTPTKSDEGGEVKEEEEDKVDVGAAKAKLDAGVAVGAEGAEAGAAEAGAAEAGAAEAGAAEAGAAEAGAAEAGAAEAGAEEGGAEEGGAEEGGAEEGGAEEGGAEEGGGAGAGGGSSPAKKGTSSAKKGTSGAKKTGGSGGSGGGDKSGSDKAGGKAGGDTSGGDKAGGKTAGGKSLTPTKPPRDEKKAGGGDKKAPKKKGKKAAKKAVD